MSELKRTQLFDIHVAAGATMVDFGGWEMPVQYPTGGLMAWSIITLLLCTIPGIVGLVKTSQINKCTSGAEQKKAISSAKTWNIVGSALGGLYVLITIIGMFAG